MLYTINPKIPPPTRFIAGFITTYNMTLIIGQYFGKQKNYLKPFVLKQILKRCFYRYLITFKINETDLC